jgi:hypothetical protein
MVGTASWRGGGGGDRRHSFRSQSWKGEVGFGEDDYLVWVVLYIVFYVRRGVEWESLKWYLYLKDMTRSITFVQSKGLSLRRQVGTL